MRENRRKNRRQRQGRQDRRCIRHAGPEPANHHERSGARALTPSQCRATPSSNSAAPRLEPQRPRISPRKPRDNRCGLEGNAYRPRIEACEPRSDSYGPRVQACGRESIPRTVEPLRATRESGRRVRKAVRWRISRKWTVGEPGWWNRRAIRAAVGSNPRNRGAILRAADASVQSAHRGARSLEGADGSARERGDVSNRTCGLSEPSRGLSDRASDFSD